MQPGRAQFPFLGSLPGWQVTLGVQPFSALPSLFFWCPKKDRDGLKEAEGEFSSSLPRKSSDQLELKTRAPESLEMGVIARDP